jgi:hypothetical protein
MENQTSAPEDMSTSNIVALSNAKEISSKSRNYSHLVILLIMVVFVFGLVVLSVFNFGGNDLQTAQISSYGANLNKLGK